MDECWSDSDAPDDIDDEDSVIIDERDNAMIESELPCSKTIKTLI